MVVSSVLMMSSDNKFDKVCNFFHSKVASLKAALESKAIGLSHKIANEIACMHTHSLTVFYQFTSLIVNQLSSFKRVDCINRGRVGCYYDFASIISFDFLKERI